LDVLMQSSITIRGARLHNLKNISLSIPKDKLVVLTGLSGSGKSTLAFDILLKEGQRQYLESLGFPSFGLSQPPIDSISGLSPSVSIDQYLTNRSPRSTVGTTTDIYTYLRILFARLGHRPCPACGQDVPPSHDTPVEWEGEDSDESMVACPHCGTALPELRMGSFSFNKPAGACPTCTGLGTIHQANLKRLVDDERSLLDGAVDGWNAPACRGRRFKPETLAVKYRDHDIAQVLDLTVEEALALFRDVPAAASRLQVMVDVSLGYLQLGQPATTLSGGEAQRVKLSKELGRRINGRTLYLLDEPTTGLHPADIARLLALLQRLVDAGNTVVVVEHQLDVIKSADWVIDLGPEGGAAGGRIIAEGTPEQIAQTPGSYTGECLRPLL
jgi:excinuclease ABC subunit A